MNMRLKTSAVAAALLLTTAYGATAAAEQALEALNRLPQHPGASAPTIVERGINHRVWQRVSHFPAPGGRSVAQTNRYVELASGLHALRDSQWIESAATIELFDRGAVGQGGAHKAIFAPNIHTIGAIDLMSPDGKRFQAHTVGLVYFDAATGRNVLFAETKDAVGELVGPNEILYRDSMDGLRVDIRCVYSRAGLESDVVLREPLPDPAEFGLDPKSTRLQVWTEFFNAPQPRKEKRILHSEHNPALRNQMVEPDFTDEVLDFGSMQMAQGVAFSSAEDEASELPYRVAVGKQWANVEGRQFLIESVQYLDMLPLLSRLPKGQAQNRRALDDVLQSRSASSHAVLVGLFPRSWDLTLSTNATVQLARGDLRTEPGVIVDYALLITASDFTFRGDTTYYVSSPVTLSGTTTIEGGTVVKFANTNAPKVTVTGPLVCLTRPYSPAVFTAKDDDTVGEVLPFSTGSPVGYYAARGLDLNYSGNTVTVENVRLRFAERGVYVNPGTTLTLRHAQIGYGYRSVEGGINTPFTIHNVLVHNHLNGMASWSTSRLEHATFHRVSTAWAGTTGTNGFLLTNSILIAVTNNVVFKGSNVETNRDDTGIFQVVGGGARYLSASSVFRNAGTTVINAALQADLQQRTTYPPLVYSNVAITAQTTFQTQAIRDTDTPDLGYHYDPIDHAFGGVDASNHIIFATGTVAGWFRTTSGWFHAGHGIHLDDQKILTFDGTPTSPCYWARCSTVQEGGTGLWDGGFGPGGITGWADQNSHDVTRSPEIKARFTRFSVLASDTLAFRDDWGYLTVRATDCEFWSGGIAGYILSAYLTNCVMERAYGAQVAGWTGNEYHVRNCTWRGASFQLNRSHSYIPVSILDTVFDNTTFVSDATNNLTYDYNAFLTGAQRLTPTGTHDLVVSDFNWQTGPIGRYYVPTNSALLDAGSRSADQAGLFYHTMTTNQAPEGLSTVDIGYHYVALDSQGQPIDNNTNGVPDAIEDRDGDRLSDAQELIVSSNPQSYDSNGNGLSDGQEDADTDLLTTDAEFNRYASDPLDAHSMSAAAMDSEWFHAGRADGSTPVRLCGPSIPQFGYFRMHLLNAAEPYDCFFSPEILGNSFLDMRWTPYAKPGSPTPGAVPCQSGSTVTHTYEQLQPGGPQGFFTVAKSVTDSDGDGIADGYEIYISRSSPDTPDTDGDRFSDGPLMPSSYMPFPGFTWLGANDAFPRNATSSRDFDGDGIRDGSDDDDDNDGVPDDIEIARGSSHTNSLSIPAPTFYVKTTGSNPSCGVGTAEDPFTTIQAALTAASSASGAYSVIQVSPGTYAGAGNYNLDFGGKRILLNSEKGFETTIINCAGAPAPGNGFVFDNNEAPYSRVVGFTIMNAPSSAISLLNGNPVITHCVLTNNATSSGNGGGINCANASPVIVNCTFLRNGNASALGGGMYVSGTSKPRLSHCTFFDNVRSTSGGQINLQSSTVLTQQNCIVWTTTGNNTEVVIGSGASARIWYCDIKAASSALGYFLIMTDPLLEPNGRLTLTASTTSPCIDRGTTNSLDSLNGFARSILYDIDGEARTPRFAVPAPAQNILFSADIGSDEFVYRLINPLDGNSFSIVDEASGVAFLGENGGLSKFALIDDETDNNVFIYHVNAQGLYSANQTITTGQDMKDNEGLAFNAGAGRLYTLSSQTKRNRYHLVDNDDCNMIDPPTSDYDRDRTSLLRFNINGTFDYDGTLPVTYLSEAVAGDAFAVNYNAANGLIAHIRNQFSAAGSPFVAENTATDVMIAFNTCSNFSDPLDGAGYAKGVALPNGTSYGTSLGDTRTAGELGAGTHTHNNTYLPGSLALNTYYWYRIWAFSQPGAVSTRVYQRNPLTVRIRTSPIYPKLYINEFQGTNPDWIELYNPAGVPMTITSYKMADRGYFNSGTVWWLPTTVVPARGYVSLTPPFGISADSAEDIYLSGPDGTQGTPGTSGPGTLGTIIDTFLGFTENGGTRGRTWDGGCVGAAFGVGGEAAISQGAANNPTDTKLFDVASAIDQATPTNYLTWRNIGRKPAVWQYSPKQNDYHSINIESLAYKPVTATPEEMIVGLRAPLTVNRTNGNAIYFRTTAITTFIPDAGGWATPAAGLTTGLEQLNLNGQGIRAISWYAAQNTYLIIGGPANGGPLEKERANEKYSLYSWNGNAGPTGTYGHIAAPQRLIEDLRPYTIRPEGVDVITIGGTARVVFAEDRYRGTGYATRNVVHWPVSILGGSFQQ